MEQQDLIKIGEFATLAGTNLRTLRYYEELGLLQPSLRSEGGFRYYRRASVHRVAMIRDLQELGLPLDRVKDIIGETTGVSDRETYIKRVRLALEQHQAILTEHLVGLNAQRDRIGIALAKLHECSGCQHWPQLGNNYCEPCGNTGGDLPEGLKALF